MDKHAIHAIILYEHRRGSSAREAASSINAALGEGTVSHCTVARWFNRFASGDMSLQSLAHPGRPVELEDDELLHQLEVQPSATTRELAQALGRHHSTIEHRLHTLGYRRVLARWIPHRLTAANRAARVSICQSLLLRPQRKDFLASLVTGDESWILYQNDARTACWLPREEEPPAQPKPETHGRKVLLCCWWDAQGMLYWELLSGDETVTAAVYTRQLRQLAAAVREKRRRRAEVHLLHDNARPHVASATRQQLEKLGWATVPHPAYSPDLAPSDYHLFHSLKNHLRGQHYSNLDQVKAALAEFFDCQPVDFWQRGIESLPKRWRQVIDAHGDYIID